MHKGIWATAATLGLALGLLTAPVEAAPAIGSGAAGLKAAGTETSAVEEVRWVRRCWRNRFGNRVCRRVWIGPRFGYVPGRHLRGHRFRGDHFRGGPRAFRAPSVRSHGFRAPRSGQGPSGRHMERR